MIHGCYDPVCHNEGDHICHNASCIDKSHFETPKLASQNCVPCRKSTPRLTEAVTKTLCQEIPDWRTVDHVLHPNDPSLGLFLQRDYFCGNFVNAIALVNQIATIAEKQQHHPEIQIQYNWIIIKIWTHSIAGLSQNDFILAAKIEEVIKEWKL